MQQRNVATSGLRVSAVGLGCNNLGWGLDATQSEKVVHAALDAGVTLFDTAPVYGERGGESERILGQALGRRRDEAVIATKFGVPLGHAGGFNTSRAAILKEVDASLARLGTDYIDLYLLHWPDPSTPMQETLRALDDIVTAGKARYVGACNLSAWQIVEAQWIAKTENLHRFIVAQNEYSLARRAADDLLPALNEYDVALLPYSPLASGLLTGKYSSDSAAPADSRLGKNMWNLGQRFLTAGKLKLADDLAHFAAQQGHTMLELAMSWLLSNPTICSVIAGATRTEQVESNVKAATAWRLSPDELAEVDRICREAKQGGAR